MQVKRFVAADMRRALELVRQELGADAIILSSNRTAAGVELLTTLPADTNPDPYAAVAGEAVAFAREREPAAPVFTAERGAASGKTGKELADDIDQARLRMLAARNAEASAQEFLLEKQVVNAGIPRRAAANKPVSIPTPAPRAAVSAAERYGLLEPVADKPEVAQAPQLADLQADLADMRLLLEQQLDRMAVSRDVPGSPVLASVGRRLERLGLPADAVAPLLKNCVAGQSLSGAWPEALANLAHQLPVAGSDVVAQGGVFAFVGPTGAGKTTTIGKLAARYVLQHGADKVALVTMDTYRIAAHDQLRSLARILRVPVRVVDENNSLTAVLRSLRGCELVLIDTAGFRHGDPQLKAQLSMLAEQPNVRNFLVLSSNSQEQMLKASVHAYRQAGLAGCILTKLDETASLGEVMGVAMQSGLPIAYTTDGQDIPQDIDVARPHKLVARAAALLKQMSAPSAGQTQHSRG